MVKVNDCVFVFKLTYVYTDGNLKAFWGLTHTNKCNKLNLKFNFRVSLLCAD